MPTQSDVVTQMIQALSITEPTLDTSIGSPIRSILDVVAETIAEQTADQYLLSYNYDVNTKTGTDLDAFVNTFGITRYPAKRAVAYVTLSCATAAVTAIGIGIGSQVATTGSPPTVFSTIIPAVLPAGGTSVTVPVQAVIAGTTGNVAANTITQFVSPLAGISTINNGSAATGGVNQESDSALQARFKATVFRSLAGSTSMYLATALDDPSVSVANVVGASEQWNEQIQLTGSPPTGISSVQNLYYLYPNSSFLGTNIFQGNIFSPGVQFSCTSEFIPNPNYNTATPTTGTGSLAAGTYVYALSAVNIAGETALGSSISATLSATGEITLAWSNPSVTSSWLTDMTYWHIWRINPSTGQFNRLAQVAYGTNTYVDNGGASLGTLVPNITNTTGTPIIRSLDTTNVPAGIYELQFNYLSSASRNDPANNITNMIDIYANGSRPVSVTQNFLYASTYVFNGTDKTDVDSAPTSMNVAIFQRSTGGTPGVGNVFTPLAFAPVIDEYGNATSINFSGSNISNGVTWVQGTNYWVVNHVSQWGGSSMSRSGIEWQTSTPPNGKEDVLTLTATTPDALTKTLVNTSSVVVKNTAGTPTYVLGTDYTLTTVGGVTSIARTASGSAITSGQTVDVFYTYNSLPVTAQYTYNQIPASVQQHVENWRLVTTNVMVHQAQVNYLDVFLSLILANNFTPASLLSAVETAISNYINSVGFDAVVQVSEILTAVQQVPGVVACRFLNSGDSSLVLYGTGALNGAAAGTHYGIQSVTPGVGGSDTVLQTYNNGGSPARVIDVYLNDSTLATLNQVYLVQQAQNTFGAV